MKKEPLITISLILLWAMIIVVLVIDIFGYRIADYWSQHSGALSHNPESNRLYLMLTLYSVSLFAYIVLLSLRRLLKNVLKSEVFVVSTTKCISVIVRSLSAAAVILFISGFYYLPFFLLSGIAAFIAMILQIVKHCFDRAISMKEELDYTI